MSSQPGEIKWTPSAMSVPTIHPVNAPTAKYNKISEGLRHVTPGHIQCSMFCGGKGCKYENPAKWPAKDQAVKGLYSSWVTDDILAMARPSTEIITKYNIIEQFQEQGIKSVVNLQRPFEHASCGNALEPESGFTYLPQDFMENDIYFYNFGWKDYGVASLGTILDMVKVMSFAMEEGKVAIHCHAGLGRTGVLIGCYLVWAKRLNPHQAIHFVREKRSNAIQTRGQIQCIQEFSQYIRPLRVIFPSQDPISSPFTFNQYLGRQKRYLHGFEARELKYIPKIVDVVCKLLAAKAHVASNAGSHTGLRRTLSKEQVVEAIKECAPAAFDNTEEGASPDSTTISALSLEEVPSSQLANNLPNVKDSLQPEKGSLACQEPESDPFTPPSDNSVLGAPGGGDATTTTTNTSTTASQQQQQQQSLGEESTSSDSNYSSNSDLGKDGSTSSSLSGELPENGSSRPRLKKKKSTLQRLKEDRRKRKSESEAINSEKKEPVALSPRNSMSAAEKVATAMAFDMSTDQNVNQEVEVWQAELNEDDAAWERLKVEKCPRVLSCLMWSWLEELKEPVLGDKDISNLVEMADNPHEALEQLEKGHKHTLMHILKTVAKLPNIPPRRFEEKVLARLITAFTKQTNPKQAGGDAAPQTEPAEKVKVMEFLKRVVLSEKQKIVEKENPTASSNISKTDDVFSDTVSEIEKEKPIGNEEKESKETLEEFAVTTQGDQNNADEKEPAAEEASHISEEDNEQRFQNKVPENNAEQEAGSNQDEEPSQIQETSGETVQEDDVKPEEDDSSSSSEEIADVSKLTAKTSDEENPSKNVEDDD
ncbi:PREDICTED: protein tyrosine phosphatase domain-containing protein 1-like [Branchiostoma belcheri]|uniref:Protein tyrosine phosphatase domain-containing protein 1 n=1 Tax=Branchiostoma belcheri TaxID=7741 RepID=A0A6P4Y3Q8_BRABE|nr:PREDICTED: protein tyrosine phosphatase domain-containing protein 1-like [Branchiostoma belcheri]